MKTMKVNLKDIELELINDQRYTPFSTDNPFRYHHQYISQEIAEGGT